VFYVRTLDLTLEQPTLTNASTRTRLFSRVSELRERDRKRKKKEKITRSLNGPGYVRPFPFIMLRYTHELVRNVRRQNAIAESELGNRRLASQTRCIKEEKKEVRKKREQMSALIAIISLWRRAIC